MRGTVHISRRTAFALGGLALATPSLAQDWPARPIRAVLGFAPGGGVDLAARVVARGMSQSLRQSVVVENRPGAGSTLAAAQVARAEADGYTIMVAETGMLIGPVLYRDTRYDPITSFAPVGSIAIAPLGIVVAAGLGTVDLPAALALGRAAPRPWRFGTPGVGTAQHLVGQMLGSAGQLPLEHVAYRGGAPAVTAVLSGDVEIGVASLPAVMPAVAAGQLRLLAVTTAGRVPTVPDVPAVAETLPGFYLAPSIFLVAPAGTPASIIQALNAALAAALGDVATRDALASAGLIAASPSTPGDMARDLAQETERWSTLARASGARLE